MFIGLDIPILRLKDIAPAALQRLEPPPEGFHLRRPTYAVGSQQVSDLHHTFRAFVIDLAFRHPVCFASESFIFSVLPLLFHFLGVILLNLT